MQMSSNVEIVAAQIVLHVHTSSECIEIFVSLPELFPAFLNSMFQIFLTFRKVAQSRPEVGGV